MQNIRNLPKRQSCDRCHKQKLRCLRPADGESGACERCTRLKTQCIYSSALPKGRPRGQKVIAPVVHRPPECSEEGFTAANHGNSAVDAELITNVLQYPNVTNNDLWNDQIPVDWMNSIDHAFTDPEQWHFELPSLDNVNGVSSCETVDSSFTSPGLHGNGYEAQIHQSAIRADSHQNTPPKKVEPESAIAALSRLSQRLYSLYSAVLALANCPDAIDQADTATLRKGPFADDSAFQRLTSWLVRASSNMDNSSVSAGEQDANTPVAADDGCALLENVFSASQKLIDTLHSLGEEASRHGPVSQGGSPSASIDQQATGTFLGDDSHHPGGPFVSTNTWSDSITKHMVMANHMLLLNTYLATVMALQHAVNKQKSASGMPNAQDFALPLGEMRTAMVVQMCGYLIQRQINAVDAYLAPSSATPLSDLSSSDQTTMKELEKDVQRRLAQLKESLPV
ncbi:unnamed protein product [Aureobasidium mustum]|uniref:Zn(2)-C6 fungal-type domain-containing protein n=1 Tax=Aureobasidium mustum TaxID=2773714 RepID=A0A9N8JMQ6_9PEZI|nr:unnamed protein product [Aureobasidium mustum]